MGEGGDGWLGGGGSRVPCPLAPILCQCRGNCFKRRAGLVCCGESRHASL